MAALRSPDVLLMQETKLADEAAPAMPFGMAGYELLHHGEGRWNGVAIASRVGISNVVTNFGDGPVRRSPGPETIAEAIEAEASGASADEARMVSATCDGVRVVSVYAPNGRALGTPFYEAKLAWFERLARWLRESCDPAEPLVVGGDFNVAPEDADVYDMATSQARRTSRNRNEPPSRRCGNGAWSTPIGCTTRSRASSRGGTTAPGTSTRGWVMRIDHLYVTRPVAERCVAARDRPRGSQGEAALGPRPGLRRPRRLSKRERTVAAPVGPAGWAGRAAAPRAWSRRGASSRRRSRMDRAWPAA